jgi:predicted nucleotidyltransferase
MPVEPQLFAIIPLFQSWASKHSDIKRIWVFGSRLKGTQRADSDLDVAIEIDPIETDEETQLVWMDKNKVWLSELQALSPFRVQLEMYGTPELDQYLACCSMLIYERAI